MRVTAFVDESGTGGQPRVMLGALVARAHRWHGFNNQWRKLLRAEKIDFSHIVAMENKKPPFKDWGFSRTRPFVAKAGPMMKKYLDFGTTVALSVADHRNHYLANLSSRSRRESCYGLCARSLIEHVTCEALAAFGSSTEMHFVFEANSQYDGALWAFRDLKAHVPLLSTNLAGIRAGDKREFPGLMAADLVASLGRRSEASAVFSEVQPGTCRVPRTHGRLPMFHVDMHRDRLLAFCIQADGIGGEKRRDRKLAKAIRAAGVSE